MEKIFLFLFLIVSTVVFAQEGNAVLTITTQPASVTIAQKNESVTLTCVAEHGESGITYQWYRNSENENAGGIAIDGANSSEYTTEVFSDREIRYYYCVVTKGGESVTSDVAAVAHTGLPTIYINCVNGEEPTADYAYPPEGAYGRGLKNATKVPSSMQILDGDGALVYESGEYVKKESGLTIKIRGNTSANLAGKCPYKLKLQAKADLLSSFLGRTDKDYEDKEWILLKDGTSLATFIGMSVCDIAGVPWTPDFTYVNVVINNNYRGVYMLIEAVAKGKKRINVDKSGYIIERDAYWWNEDVKFVTSLYNQKYTFKYPDVEDITEEQLDYIENYMNTLEEHVADGTYDDYLDVESFARWLLIHDILGTQDAAGSNMYMYKKDNTDESKIYMATNWDFGTPKMDNIDSWSQKHNDARVYAKYLFQSSNRNFIQSYQIQWESIKNNLWSSLSGELENLKDNIGNELNLSRKCDALRWNTVYSSVDNNILQAKKWFVSRTERLSEALEGSHSITYNLDGGNFVAGLDYPESFKFDDVINIPNPKRTGYAFTGWSSETISYLESKLTFYGCKFFSDVTLTAKWKKLLGNSDIVVTNIPSQTYTGTELIPEISVVDGSTPLIENTDYTVSVSGDCINTGDYTVTITGKGHYSGTVKRIFSIIPAVASYGALTISTDQDGQHAVLDGNSTSALSEITSPITVDDIVFERQFSVGKPSTIVLPFTTSNYSGGTFYTFTDVSYDEDKSKWYADLTEETSVIVAHKPYIFIPSAESLTFPDGVTIEKSPEKEMITPGKNTNWTFKGVYAYNVFETVTGKEYGFAGKEAKDGDIDIAIGDFVHIGAGAKIKPFRCYLTFNGESLSKSAIELPSCIEVRIVEPVATVEPVESPVVISEEGTSTDVFDEDILTPISEISRNNGTKVWSYGKTIFIEAQPNTDYQIFDINGRILKTAVTSSDHDEVSLSHNVGGIAIVRIANKSYKVKY